MNVEQLYATTPCAEVARVLFCHGGTQSANLRQCLSCVGFTSGKRAVSKLRVSSAGSASSVESVMQQGFGGCANTAHEKAAQDRSPKALNLQTLGQRIRDLEQDRVDQSPCYESQNETNEQRGNADHPKDQPPNSPIQDPKDSRNPNCTTEALHREAWQNDRCKPDGKGQNQPRPKQRHLTRYLRAFVNVVEMRQFLTSN